ncbi:MAG: hypothetical protein AB7N91_10815 [Candidatus Tectimicrobiota bacterium]
MKAWTSLLLLPALLYTACGLVPPHEARSAPAAPVPASTSAPLPDPTYAHPLLRDLQTYCYACHHGDTGQVFDRFSRQPAFFAGASETEVLQHVREIAGRAVRYLRSAQMPKSTDPGLPKDKRRDLIKELKTLGTTPTDAPVARPDVQQLAQVQAAYDQQLRATLAYKCGVCHAQEANLLQHLLFGGAIDMARHAWDSSEGFPFGGDYRQDPLLQLSRLEVAVVTQSMPPVYYTASFPDRHLTSEDLARLRAWITQARAAYGYREPGPEAPTSR